MPEYTHQPGRALRRWGAAVLLTSLVLGILSCGFGAWTIYRLATTINHGMLAREIVPGTLDFTAPEPGRYMVFYEHESQINGQQISSPATPPSFSMTLYDNQGNALNNIEPPSVDYSYAFISHEGFSIRQLSIPAAGDYTLEADTSDPGPFVLAIGRMSVGMVAGVVLSILVTGLLVLGFITGLVLFIVGFAQRGRAD